jgi:uncharacterized protein (TIGR02246 family)
MLWAEKETSMKKAVLAAALAVVLAAIPASAPAAGSGEKVAIDHLNHEFVTAWNAHDAKKMAAVWAENGDLINPFGKKASNRAGVEKIFQEEQAGVMKASTYKIESFSMRELNHATAIGDWDSVVTGMVDPAGKPLPPFPHHVTVVYVNEGGHWWAGAVRAHSNPPAPGAESK